MQARKFELTQNAIRGLQAFNRQDFYESHEWFEKAWQESPLEIREFYRALLHLSGGYYRMTQDRPEAAIKFFKRTQFWLRPFPNPNLGINTDQIRKDLSNLLLALGSHQSTHIILQDDYHSIKFTPEEVL